MLYLCLPARVSDSVDFFSRVANLQNKIRDSSDSEVIVGVPSPDFLKDRTNLFLLACLSAVSERCEKKMFVDETVNVDFQKNEVMKIFQLDRNTDIVGLVRKNIFSNVPINMTGDFGEELVSSIAEIYNNAIEHSKAQFIMGICYKSKSEYGKDKLCFCCYDTGVGIIGNVRHYRVGDDTDPIFKTYKAGVYFLRWALESGNSTKQGYARGLGLARLLKFSEINHGFIRICNENVLFEKGSAGKQGFRKMNGEFLGSFFEMHIMEHPGVRYKLKGE